VLIPQTGPLWITSDGSQSFITIVEGDELWIWTHEDDKFGRGWGLTAKAQAGKQHERDGFLAITLEQVERLPRPFGFRDLGDGPTSSGLLNRVHNHRHHQAYLFDDAEYADFIKLVEQRGSPLPDEVRYAHSTDWDREIRNHKKSLIEGLANRKLAWRKPRPVQQAFRDALIERHSGLCVLTRCGVPEALESAHVMPHTGDPLWDRPDNGLLLRRDLHSMFDAMLWSIDPATDRVRFSKRLTDPSYAPLNGKIVDHKVAKELMRVHFIQFQKADIDV
jgi:hypothetical protein